MHSTKSIAIFLHSLSGGGAERVAVNLARGFAERGCSVDLVLAQAAGPYLKDVPKSVRLCDLGVSNTYFALPKLVRYLRQRRPHAILSVLDPPSIVATLAHRLAKVPARLVVSVHSTTSVSISRTPNLHTKFIAKMVRRLYPIADEIVAVSHGAAEDLVAFLADSRAKVRVIYNPVVTPELLRKSREPLNHPWFLPGAPPVILTAGRLNKVKNFPSLIVAFSILIKHMKAHLIILGEGEDRARLEQLVQQLGLQGLVAMPGFVENPYAYMRRANLFVLSSLWEGLPTVLIEAMACGTHVVATDCPSGPREILEDGKWGKLVPVDDPQALAEAMLNTLRNPPPFDPAIRAADFSLERAVEAYLDVLGIQIRRI